MKQYYTSYYNGYYTKMVTRSWPIFQFEIKFISLTFNIYLDSIFIVLGNDAIKVVVVCQEMIVN